MTRIRTPLAAFVAVACMVCVSPATAADPVAPPAVKTRVTVKDYRPLGLVPSDLEAFLNGFGDKLSPQERADFREQWETFKDAWAAFELGSERTLRKALDDLGSPDAAVVAAARAELTRTMAGYPSSFTVFRAVTNKLSPASAVRFTQFCMDFTAARDVWQKQAHEITTAIKAGAHQKAMVTVAAANAVQEAVAVRRSLKHMRTWKDQITRAEDPGLLTISRTMDYYERCDARSVNRLIAQAPTLLGPDLHRQFQHEVMTRMPQRPEVVAE